MPANRQHLGTGAPLLEDTALKAIDIRPGQLLRLKKDRAEDFGEQDDSLPVKVARLEYRGGYKTPWIVSERPWIDLYGEQHALSFYRPSDFKGLA